MGDRYVVRPSRDQHGGDGWMVWDVEEDRAVGGWFTEHIRSAAEATAADLNAAWRREEIKE